MGLYHERTYELTETCVKAYCIRLCNGMWHCTINTVSDSLMCNIRRRLRDTVSRVVFPVILHTVETMRNTE
jgi:hypothetical protein